MTSRWSRVAPWKGLSTPKGVMTHGLRTAGVKIPHASCLLSLFHICGLRCELVACCYSCHACHLPPLFSTIMDSNPWNRKPRQTLSSLCCPGTSGCYWWPWIGAQHVMLCLSCQPDEVQNDLGASGHACGEDPPRSGRHHSLGSVCGLSRNRANHFHLSLSASWLEHTVSSCFSVQNKHFLP